MTSLFRSAGGPLRPLGLRVPACAYPCVADLSAQLRSQDIHPPTSFSAALQSLARESDSALAAEGVYSLAARAEVEGNLPLAVATYHFLAESCPTRAAGEDPAAPWRRRAEARLEVLRGGGSFGERSELFLRHFARDVADPALMLGMGVAGGVFRMTRLLALSRLEGLRRVSPLAVRALAGAAGTAVEAPAFVATTRGVHAALGAAESHPQNSLGRELLSSYLFLGAMRFSGGVADRLHRGWVGSSEALAGSARVSSVLFPQAGMLGGILLSHRLETWAGLRREQSSAATLAESLATLLHFNVSGRLFHQLVGPRFRRWEQAMDLQARAMSRPLRPFSEGFSMAEMAILPVCSEGKPTLGELGNAKDGVEPLHENFQIQSVRSSSAANSVEEPIGDLLVRFTRLTEGQPQAAASLDLGASFAKRVSDWGYDWQELKMREYAPDLSRLRDLHDAIQRGRRLNSEELGYLDRLADRAEKESGDFEANRKLLTQIVVWARQGRAEGRRPEDMATDRVLHDLSHRPQFLQIMGLAVGDLQLGIPLEEYYLQQLNPQSGFTLAQTLKEGMVMASVESSDLVARVGKGLRLEGLDEIHLKQGSEAARGLGDIVANLLTNTWRYQRQGVDLSVQLEAVRRANGSMQISVRDNGIGIESANLSSIGSHGFRESRVELSRSHGFGIASVIANLRHLDWGPLWVRSRAGLGSEFRFEIPAQHLLSFDGVAGPRVSSVDKLGQGAKTSLETNLEYGYMVPASSLDLAIRQLMREIPPGPFSYEPIGSQNLTRLQALKNGTLRHRRLEGLHRLLAQGRPIEEIEALENGPGAMVDVASTLMGLGSRLFLKEPDSTVFRWHHWDLAKLASPEQRDRVWYFKSEKIDRPRPFDVVYWPNPNTVEILKPASVSLGDYLGRDVRPGGFLVVQSDHHIGAFRDLKALDLDPMVWERIFDEALPDSRAGSNSFLPTAQNTDLHLQVYRRRP